MDIVALENVVGRAIKDYTTIVFLIWLSVITWIVAGASELFSAILEADVTSRFNNSSSDISSTDNFCSSVCPAAFSTIQNESDSNRMNALSILFDPRNFIFIQFRSDCLLGNEIMNSVPFPGSEMTSMFPLCCSIIP